MTLSDLLTILVIALAVLLPKALPLLLVSDRMHPLVRRWLDYVAPAVLAALVAPSIFTPDRVLAPPRLEQLVFVATFIAAVITRRMLPSVASGLVVLVAVVLLSG
jgi:branched-subunit amino acid transport protein